MQTVARELKAGGATGPRLAGLGLGMLLALSLAACGGGGAEERVASRQAPPGFAAEPDARAGAGPVQLEEGGLPQVGPEAPRLEPGAPLPQPSLRALTLREQPRGTGGFAIQTTDREAVRLFFRTVYAASDGVDSGWSGSIAGCQPGDTRPEYKDAVLRRVNWFRAMAGVPAEVRLDPVFSRKAQQAALVMAANNQLSHHPPSTWACNNAEASEAARSSNLSLGHAGPDAVVGQMRDNGSNNAAAGHRRWILYPQTRLMGTGDVTGAVSANSLWVFDDQAWAPRPRVRDEFVAWPPPGFVPFQTVYPRWSFSYPQADFSAARVSMSENGAPLAVRLEPISSNIGENTLVWLPGAYTDSMRWARPSADTTYTVQVDNVRIGGSVRSFSYSVTVFDPDVGTFSQRPQGSATARVGQIQRYGFEPWPQAGGHQWRTLSAREQSLSEGFEGEPSGWSVQTSAGYSPWVPGLGVGGSRAIRFAHPRPEDQTAVLPGQWLLTDRAALRFSSRLGVSSPNQKAKVEVSVDGGRSWSLAWEQAGTVSGTPSGWGETEFQSRSVALARWQDRVVQLRLRYAVEGNPYTYYPQANDRVGWFVDNVRLEGALRVESEGEPQTLPAGVTDWTWTPTQLGTTLLQLRPLMAGLAGEWGPVLAVSVGSGSPAAAWPSDAAIDCLLNWAEDRYPALLAPRTASVDSPPWRYRAYTATGLYVGISRADQQLYLLQAGQLQALGAVANWLRSAGCPL